MLRIAILCSHICIAFLCTAPLAFAQDIAIFKSENNAILNEAITSFRVNCKYSIKEYDMEKMRDRGEAHVEEMNKTKPKVVLALGAMAATLAKEKLDGSIQIVYAMVINDQVHDLKSGNVTGIAWNIPIRTQLHAIHSILESVKKVGVVYNPKNTGHMLKEGAAAASAMGFALAGAKVDAPGDVVGALTAFADGAVQALWMTPDPTVFNPGGIQALLQFSFENNVPVITFSKQLVKHGALFSISTNYTNIGQQACLISKDILDGGLKAGSIPIGMPKGLEIYYNPKTAKAIQLSNIATNLITFAQREGYKISFAE